MLVVLTAFNGMLKSEPMEWPQESTLKIHLPMPLDTTKVYNIYDKPEFFTPGMGTFYRCNNEIHVYPAKNGQSLAVEYRLIEWVPSRKVG